MLQVSPTDALQVLNSTGALRNPVGTAMSFLGLSGDEQKAGVPGWAYAVIALGIGVYVGAKYGKKVGIK